MIACLMENVVIRREDGRITRERKVQGREVGKMSGESEYGRSESAPKEGASGSLWSIASGRSKISMVSGVSVTEREIRLVKKVDYMRETGKIGKIM